MIIRVKPAGQDKEYYFEIEGKIKASRIGGGMVVSIPLADVVEFGAVPPEVWRKVRVGFDDPEPTYEAYVSEHEKWNGWECPRVEKAELVRFLDDQGTNAEASPEAGYTTGMLLEDGSLLWHTQDDGWGEVQSPETILFEGREVQVWDISNGLIWQEWAPEQLQVAKGGAL